MWAIGAGAVLMTLGLLMLALWLKSLEDRLTEEPGGFRATIKDSVNQNRDRLEQNRGRLDMILEQLAVPTPTAAEMP